VSIDTTTTMAILKRDFYNRNACQVARDLLGAHLVRFINDQRVSGIIVETEAYRDGDAASHAYRGRTSRNTPMWQTPGISYVYLTYGMHWLLNAVVEPENAPAAVLIRAIQPLDGLDIIAENRYGRPPREWTNGPARTTMALNINAAQNQVDLTSQSDGLWIESADPIPDSDVCTGPRIGLGKNVPEPWRSIPWRWWLKDNPHVSHISKKSNVEPI